MSAMSPLKEINNLKRLNRIFLFTASLLITGLMLISCSSLSTEGERIALGDECAFCHDMDEATGAHDKHVLELGLTCDNCHPGVEFDGQVISTDYHMNDQIDIILTGPDSSSSGTYSFEEKTCANVYCHGGFEGGLNTTVSWNSDSGMTCESCHGAPPPNGLHPNHSGFDCDSCHQGYSVTDTFAVKNLHANGVTNILFGYDTVGHSGLGAPSFSEEGCSNIGCHNTGNIDIEGVHWVSNSVVRWDDSVNCNSCHDYTDHKVEERLLKDVTCYACHRPDFHTTPDSNYTVACNKCHDLPPHTGAHTMHSDTMQYDCGLCHNGYSVQDTSVAAITHINGEKNVNGGLEGGLWDASGLSCSNVYCHGAFPGGSNAVVNWNDSLLNCNSCHSKNTYSTPHQGHVDKYGMRCDICHAGYNLVDSVAANLTHINKIKDVNSHLSGGAFDSVGNSCSNVYCHGNFAGGLNNPVIWQDAEVNCNFCHLSPSSGGAHEAHVTGKGYECNYCHPGYSLADSQVSMLTHVNGLKDVDSIYGGGTFNPVGSSCSNVYCHGNFVGGENITVNWYDSLLSCN
ncbi:MAG: CxxxxCH/CxxCH domain-containing protein, partial [Fibrobacteria bacterium]|nr:CxxxxCH/CxxCH domain-containing protein [Fibrobacteria bacterium]